MKKIVKHLKKKKHHTHLAQNSQTEQTFVDKNDRSASDTKEDLSFEVAVMGYTLKNHIKEAYQNKEDAFLNHIKKDNIKRGYFPSQTYIDISDEVDVTINLISDMDPLNRYECSHPNGISLRSDACIIMYDPTREKCLVNLEMYFNNLVSCRNLYAAGKGIMIFVGINGDIPEQHKFTKKDILEKMRKLYNEELISIYSINLNDPLCSAERVQIILKNLAIACYNYYKQQVDDRCSLTALESIPRPLSLPKQWETPYSFFTTLREVNATHINTLPRELITYITMILIESIFQDYDNPAVQWSLYNEMFREESTYLSKQLSITNSLKLLTNDVKTTVDNKNDQQTNTHCLLM